MPIASGANPVASALGNRTRRDPGAAVRTYHEGLNLTPRTGTFYFGGNRNFLLWSDKGRWRSLVVWAVHNSYRQTPGDYPQTMIGQVAGTDSSAFRRQG